MGDYNINLFNYQFHDLTADSVDTIFWCTIIQPAE